MNSNKFADRLKSLMKERKISGQRIADAVDVSQKTISRYATGESEPTEGMQRSILSAIAELSGHPEDASMNWHPHYFESSLSEWLELADARTLSDDEEGEMWENLLGMHQACWVFSLLEECNQKFVLDNFGLFCGIDVYEVAIIEAFADISESKRRFVLDSLETVRLGFSELKSKPAVCRKISDYMGMVQRCRALKPEKWEMPSDMPLELVYTKKMRKYSLLLEKTKAADVEKMCRYLPKMVTFDEKEWYLLALVQILALRDRGENKTTYEDKEVGDKVHGLISWLVKEQENASQSKN